MNTCRACGHGERADYGSGVVWFYRLIRRPVPPARCPHKEFDYSGLSDQCECREPFHGS